MILSPVSLMRVGSLWDRRGGGCVSDAMARVQEMHVFFCSLTERKANVPSHVVSVKNYFPVDVLAHNRQPCR